MDYPGQVNPLDGTDQFAEKGVAMFSQYLQYWLQYWLCWFNYFSVDELWVAFSQTSADYV